MNLTHVAGKSKGKLMLYALSTCGWCKKTRTLLEDLGVEYDYIYVDLLKGTEQDAALSELRKFNPDCNFPTLVIDDDKCVIGYREDDIKEALGK